MGTSRRLALLVSSVLVGGVLAVAPYAASPAAAAELLAGGGFENTTGNPPNSPSWTEADNRWGGSPLCTTSACGSVGGTSVPRTGSGFARFGGESSPANHTASIAQTVTIPRGAATLTYWYRNSQVQSPFNATLQVRVDNQPVFTHTETSAPQAAYSQQTVSLTAYADGNPHTLSFVFANNSAGTNRMLVDDVSLDHVAPVATPTLTGTDPASPSPSTTPRVKGSAAAGSTVRIYPNNTCSGTPVGTGTASDLAGAGVTVTVPANATTTLWARASIAGQPDSACSTTSVTYTSDSTAPSPVTLTGTVPGSPGSSLTPAVRGTAEAGSTVTLWTTSTCTGTPAATGTAAAFASPGLTVTVAAGSTTTFRATARDAAGNTSACSSSTATYTHDATAPTLVQVTGVDPAGPSNVLTPKVSGTAEAGSTVRLYTTADCSGAAVASGTAAAFASPGLTVTVGRDRTTTFRATATDPAGNTSPCSSSSVSYTSDNTAPAVAVTDVTPSGTSTTPTVRGTAEAGSTVRVYGTAGCTGTPLVEGTAAAFADPGLTATVVLGSTTTFRATATDAAGNTSGCSAASAAYTSDLLDGGFEAAVGDPPDSPFWFETDSVSGTPLCIANASPCGDIDAQTRPHSGSRYAWFGGFPDAGQTASLAQAVTFPSRGPVLLTLWYKNTTVSAPYDAQLLIQVDGQTVRTITEATTEDADYQRFVVDLSGFADGGNHVLALVYDNGTPSGVSNMLVDDLSLGATATPGARTAVPVVVGTAPGSPATSTTPLVTGTAEAGSRVRLYDNASCSGTPLGAGPAADFAAGGVRITVPAGSTTRIHAQAVKAGQDDSFCSTTSATYRVLTAPDTTITKAPKAKVKAKKGKKKAKVAFAFSSPTAGATFQCSLDGKAWAACTSGKVWKLKKGKHTFAVRAVANGLVDATPATWTGTVKRRKR